MNASVQDGLRAFGPLAAKALKADYQVVGWAAASFTLKRE